MVFARLEFCCGKALFWLMFCRSADVFAVFDCRLEGSLFWRGLAFCGIDRLLGKILFAWEEGCKYTILLIGFPKKDKPDQELILAPEMQAVLAIKKQDLNSMYFGS